MNSNVSSLMGYTTKFRAKWFIRLLFVLLTATGALKAQHVHPGHILTHDPRSDHTSTLSLTTEWESKYISEGRNNLEDGGLGSVTLEWNQHYEKNELLLLAWYGEGTSSDYSELNLGIAYLMPLDPVDVTLGYTWLDFSPGSETDNELSLELGFGSIQFIDLSADFVYSTEAGGTFIQLIASHEIELEGSTLVPYALVATNQGYVTDEHDGLNNFQLGFEWKIEVDDHIEVFVNAAHASPINKRTGDSFESHFWGGIGLTYSR